LFKQLFADAYLYSYEQAELARHYRRYLDLMKVWRERFPDRIYDVIYEDLVSDSKATLNGVLQHLGLSWQQQCLDFANHQTAVTTASAAQVREKPHQRSIGRWQKYEDRLQTMSNVLSDHKIPGSES